MNNFFELNRPITNEEAKEWLESYLGAALISTVSIWVNRTYARVVARTENGNQDVKISLPMVLDRGTVIQNEEVAA